MIAIPAADVCGSLQLAARRWSLDKAYELPRLGAIRHDGVYQREDRTPPHRRMGLVPALLQLDLLQVVVDVLSKGVGRPPW